MFRVVGSGGGNINGRRVARKKQCETGVCQKSDHPNMLVLSRICKNHEDVSRRIYIYIHTYVYIYMGSLG